MRYRIRWMDVGMSGEFPAIIARNLVGNCFWN